MSTFVLPLRLMLGRRPVRSPDSSVDDATLTINALALYCGFLMDLRRFLLRDFLLFLRHFVVDQIDCFDWSRWPRAAFIESGLYLRTWSAVMFGTLVRWPALAAANRVESAGLPNALDMNAMRLAHDWDEFYFFYFFYFFLFTRDKLLYIIW